MATNRTLAHTIIIDDDFATNAVARQIIRSVSATILTDSFVNPFAGMAKVKSLLENPTYATLFLFIDIHMPTISGWAVLEDLEPYISTEEQERIRVYLLCSEYDKYDEARAAEHPLVAGYIEKPLVPKDLINALKGV